MQYNIIGDSLPVLLLQLEQGETVQCESGAMSWMDKGIRMDTKAGGIGKAVGRMFSGESLFLNHYHAEQAGELALAATFPGSIRAIEVTPDRPIVAQKSAFLAMIGNVNMSVFFQKKIGAGLVGGEGFIMQKFEGSGLVFLEIDGTAVEYDLQMGQQKIVDTGYLAMMDASVSMDVETVGSLKNAFFGGEGIFNTVLTGPGHIVIQSLPAYVTARNLARYIPSK